MIILLSPAKTLDYDSEVPIQRSSDILFPEETENLIKKLKKFSPSKLKKMMDISNDLAQLNAERYAEWSPEFPESRSRQAVFAFKGDVYQGLEVERLNEKDLSFAQDHLRILSGLYGILRPLDQIQPYRLEMGTSWKITPKTQSLYAYWKGKLTRQLKEDVESTRAKFILNLASIEYSKSVDFDAFDIPVIAPEFKEERGGEFKMITFFAKKARGLLAAYAVKNKIESSDQLKSFDYEGYTFNERLSDLNKNKWVYTRKPQTT